MSHVSDHCCVSHRYQTITHILAGAGTISSASISFDRKSFVCGLLKGSQDLLLARPGNEALWYHRRSLIDLALGVLVRSPLLETTVLSVDSAVIVDLTSTLHAIKDASSAVIVSDDEEEDDGRGGGGGEGEGTTGISVDDENGLASTYESLILGVTADAASSDVLVAYMRSELALCLHCMKDDGVWNFDKQKMYCMRYVAFLVHRVRCAIDMASKSSGEGVVSDPLMSFLRHAQATIGFDKVPQ
jgi:hypothetical protein